MSGHRGIPDVTQSAAQLDDIGLTRADVENFGRKGF